MTDSTRIDAYQAVLAAAADLTRAVERAEKADVKVSVLVETRASRHINLPPETHVFCSVTLCDPNALPPLPVILDDRRRRWLW